MPRLGLAVLAATIVVGGWYFLNNYRVDGLTDLKVQPRGTAASGFVPGGQDPEWSGRGVIRIAALNAAPLDRTKLGQRGVAGQLAQVLRQFDVVALQDIRARDHSVLVELVEHLNAEGRQYDFAAPPTTALGQAEEYLAFVFDRAAVEVDRRTVCEVEDRQRRFRVRPLIAAFRARGPADAEAFTFTLLNVHIDPQQTAEELALLDDAFRAVRDDSRGEDDVILLGDLGIDDEHLGELATLPWLTCAVSGMPSTTRGTRLVDNVAFDARATAEYTGRAGVTDLMRELNLTIREALAVSDHLPVWAEFSVFEGGQSGHVARQ